MSFTLPLPPPYLSAANDALDAHDWLQQYDARSSVFTSPSHSLLAHGQALRLQADDAQGTLCAQADALLQQAVTAKLPPILLGILPFNVTRPSYLFVPKHATLFPHVRAAHTATETVSATLTPHPSAAEYAALVARSLPQLNQHPLSKIVLARTMEVALEQPLQRRQLIANLMHLNPQGYNFAINLADEAEDNPCFFGASPELLVRRKGQAVSVNPLAGTAARDINDPHNDQAIGQALLASPKDLHEHAIVIDNVVAALAPFCVELEVPSAPCLAKTATLWHLSTPIRGRLKAPYATSLRLALAMHPTPAVCGEPTLAARDYIESVEPFDRQFFTGAVGWNNSDGDGEWAVAIRCGHYQAQHVRLYAGAGIVSNSDPVSESRETGNKLRTMLTALRIDPNYIQHSIEL